MALLRAVAGDLPELGRLERETPGSGAERALAADLAAGRLLVLRSRREIVAWSCLRLVADELQIEQLAVAGSWRRRGLGRKLLSLLLRLGLARGAASAWLEVRRGNTAARALYSSAGFEVTGQRRAYYASPPDDAILLARRLGVASSVEFGRGAC